MSTPFKPKRGGGRNANTSTTPITINIGAGERSLRVLNNGTFAIFFRTFKLADGVKPAVQDKDTYLTVFATPAASIIIDKNRDDDAVSVVSAGPCSVHVQPGEGGY